MNTFMKWCFVILVVCGRIFAQAPLPPDCANAEFTKTGRPVMFPARHGLALGISTQRETFIEGEPIILNIWADNQTDEPYGLESCGTFLSWGVEVRNADGKLVQTPSKERDGEQADTAKQSESGRVKFQKAPPICFRNILVALPPHICEPAIFGGMQQHSILANLAPGRYTVTERGTTPPPPGLDITVVAKSENGKAAQEIVQPPFSLSISTPPVVVKVGTEIRLELVVTNTSNHEIAISDEGGSIGEVDVRDSDGNLAPFTTYNRVLHGSPIDEPNPLRKARLELISGSRRTVYAQPAQQLPYVDFIDKLYSLTKPGTYSVRVSVIDRETKSLVKSNVITLTVAE